MLCFTIGGGTIIKLVDGYKKVENSVVGGYQKVEETVVDGYKK